MREEPNKNSDGQVDMEGVECLNHKSCTANCRCDFFQNSRQRVRLHSVVTSLRNDRPSQVDADKFEETENPQDGKDDRTVSPKCKTPRKRDTTQITSNERREYFDFMMNKKKTKQRKQLTETSIEVVDQSVESTCVTVVSSSDSKNGTSNSESTGVSQPQDPVLLNLDSQANTAQLPFIPTGMPPVMSFPGGNQQALVFLVGSPGMPVTGDLASFGNMAPGAPFANAVFLGQPLTLNVVSPDGSSTGGVIEKAMELANVGTNSLGSGGQQSTQDSSDLVVSQGEFLGQGSHCTLQSVASQSTFPTDSSYNTLPQVSQGIVIAPSVTGENISIDNVSQSVTIQTSQVSQNQVGNGATFLQILNAAAASSGPEISPPKMIYKRKGASYREVMTQTGGDPEVIILSEGKKQFEEDQLMEEATDNEKEITAAKKPGSEKVRRFTCDICDKKFYTNHDLRRHHTIHQDSRPFVCEVCKKTFRTHGELKLHIAIHNEDTPYKCEFCGKEFRTKGCVKSHVKYHIGDKRHKCTECDRAFVKSADLKRHMAGHRNEKKFVCDDCGSAFTRRDNLKAHRLLHSRESVVTCDLCSKEFINAVYLKRHMHIHKQAKKKPYECQWCPKTYEQLEGLRRHIRQHVGDEKFVCKHCAKKFITSIQLKRHLWLSHEQDSPYRRSIL